MNKSRKCRYGALLLASLLAGTVTVQSSLAYIVTQSQTAVNTFKPKPVLEGGLIISKTVQHPYGAEYAVPDGITFDFNVSLGSYYAGYTLDTTAGSVTADKNGDIQLTVEQGEYIGIENLEDGMTVLVSEIQQNDDGFTVLDNITDMSLTISADDTAYADFINIYDPAPAVPENVFIYGEKILYGRDWQDGDSFKFILAQQDANGNWNNIGTEEIIYDGSEDFSIFDFSSIIQTIELDALGSHTFRITEESGSLENMTYDSAECIFEIVVSDDDMDGSMEIADVSSVNNSEVSQDTDGNYLVDVSFTNSYVTTTSTTTTTTTSTTTTSTTEPVTTTSTTTSTTVSAGPTKPTTTSTTTTSTTEPVTTTSTTASTTVSAGPTKPTTTSTTVSAGPTKPTTTSTTTTSTTKPVTTTSTTTSTTTVTPKPTTTSTTTTTKPTTTSTTTTTTSTTTTTTTTTTTSTTTTTTTTSRPIITETTTTTTTPDPDVRPVESQIVASPIEPHFYFSVDDRDFKARELFEYIILQTVYSDGTVVETDIIDDVDFNGMTPEFIFREEAAPNVANDTYYGVHASYVSPYYNGEKIDAESLVYIGVKGDTNLNGKIDIQDATLVLKYYAYVGANIEPSLNDDDVEYYETLAFFLADVNTESLDGKNTVNGTMEISDASDILTYYALVGASLEPHWEVIIPSLTEKVGSLWYDRANS